MLVRGADGQFFIFPVFHFPARTGCVEILTPASHRRHLGQDAASIQCQLQVPHPESSLPRSGPFSARACKLSSGGRTLPLAATAVSVQ